MVNPNDGTTVLNTPKSTGACFVAGTLVHTDKGLVAIEQLKVGDFVLSKSESGEGSKEYKRVTKTFSRESQEIFLVEYVLPGEKIARSLVVTSEHPFWVDRVGWTSASSLRAGHDLVIHRDSSADEFAMVFRVQIVWDTEIPDVGWCGGSRDSDGWDREDGPTVDLRNGAVNVTQPDEYSLNHDAIALGEPLLRQVFNIEVADFHTYYVGEAGVWVHSTHCNEKTTDSVTAIDRSITKDGPLAGNTHYHAEFALPKATKAYEAELTSACFGRDTKVHTIDGFCPIEFLSVGSLVLSRCEKTGEQAYRRITKTFEHEDRPTFKVKFQIEDGQFEESQFGCLYTTAEHPFWVNGVGWVAASQLQPEQQLEIVDTDLRPDIDRPEGQKLKDYQTDGKRRTARVISVTPSGYRSTVYNIEVEEFHTYFVDFEGVWVHNKTNPPV
jgi:hypothetical protein